MRDPVDVLNRKIFRTRAEARAKIFDYIERFHHLRVKRRLEIAKQNELLNRLWKRGKTPNKGLEVGSEQFKQEIERVSPVRVTEKRRGSRSKKEAFLL